MKAPHNSYPVVVITFLFIVMALTGVVVVIVGTQSGELNRKIVQPFNSFAKSLVAAFQSIPAARTTVTTNTYVATSSSSVIIINNEGTKKVSTGTPTRKPTTVPAVKVTSSPVRINFVTPTPNPTLVKWQEDVKKKQEEMQKSFEESKRKVCAQMPDAPGCN